MSTDQRARTKSSRHRHWNIGPLTAALAAVLVFGSVPCANAQSSSADSARVETPGPSSRRSPLVISEIMYHPAARADSNNLEFVELYNSQLWPEDISGYRLAGAVQYTFPTGTVLAAESMLVVAADATSVGNVYGITNVVGPFTGRLANNSDSLRLLNRSGAVLLEVPYSDETPWPVAADGAGHSLVLARPSFGEGDPRAWAASDVIGGSPGRLESVGAEPLREVMINELLGHSTPPNLDYIELYNHSNQPADLSGAHLTDDPATNKFTFPPGTVIAARGFLALNETQLGFALSSSGETVYLINSNGTRILDAPRFGAQARDVAFGRSPDGSALWSELATNTPGAANSAPLARDIVINEIMYAPLSRDDHDQFVELYNRGTNSVDVSGWRFVSGINFTVPSGTSIASGNYLVVAKNAARLRTNYSNLDSSNLVGDFDGKLSGRGERLALAMPESVVSTNQGERVTNVHYIVVNGVTYGTGGRWSKWADGGGSSLELIDAHSDNRFAGNWADSDESAKAPWTLVEQAGRVDLGVGTPNSIHLLLLGAGECLVDDVEVRGANGVNLLANPGFESGLSPWVMQGSHETSFLQNTGGFTNSRCLHVRADSDGDTGANRIRTPLTSALAINGTATFRYRVRWLRGHPEILLRTLGSYFEAFGRMTVPANLGTPGARNSRAIANAGPVIFDVRHEPVLPAAGQSVTVTARLNDPDGLALALLKYRVDPGSNFVAVPLRDDGILGDTIAADGIHSATIPGQAGNALAAFHIVASDTHAQSVTNSFPSDAPARECLVRFGETQPAGKFGAYRVWITQATFNQWAARLKTHNSGLDATFVYGRDRVIYNAGALYAGSAFHGARYTSPTGVACDYKLIFPEDELFLGSDEARILWPGLTAGDPVDTTAQREPTCYWMAGELGLPFNYQRYVHFILNGTRRSFIMQDTQKPDRDLVRQWFVDDSDGELFKISIWYEYDDAASTAVSGTPALLGNLLSDGAKKTAAYRWRWVPQGIRGTANDYTNLFALVDAVNAQSNIYTASVESLVDVEQWMRTFAFEHIVGNWDSYGYSNGQNMYAYKSRRDPWRMMVWDIDVSLGNASDQPTDDLFKFTNPYFPGFVGDPSVVGRMYAHPKFVRAFWRAVRDAVNGPLLKVNALLDARAAAFAANGVAAAAPDPIKTFLSTRRTYCLSRLATVAANFAVTTPAPSVTATNLVSLSGSAPIEARDILINGVALPVTWNSVTSWTAQVFVQFGTNQLTVQARDGSGALLSFTPVTNTVVSTAPSVPPVSVFINEWMASNTSTLADPADGDFEDWFELFNPGTNTVDLAGYYLTDALTNKLKYLITTNGPHTITPNGFLLVWADEETGQNLSGGVVRSDLHVNFQLSRTGEVIGLFAADGRLIDAVTFAQQTNDVSQGRIPDAGSEFQFLAASTPRASNRSTVIASIERLPNRDIALSWSANPGKTYRVEYKNELSDPEWVPLGDDHPASETRLTVVDPARTTGTRFYRIREL